MTDRAHLCELSMPCFAAVESITRVPRTHPRCSVRAAASLVDSNHASGQLSTHQLRVRSGAEDCCAKSIRRIIG